MIPEFCLKFILNYPFISYVFLFSAVLGLRCRAGLSSLAAAHALLTAVASLVAERGLEGARASVVAMPGLGSCGSRALEQETQ